MDELTDDDRLVDALAQTAFWVTSALNRVAADNDMSITQLRMLGILRGRSPRMTDLATHLGLEKSTLSGLIDRAERRGLVTRRPSDDDKRAIEIALTPQGDDAARRLESDVRSAILPHTRRIDSTDQTHLTAILEKMLGPTAP